MKKKQVVAEFDTSGNVTIRDQIDKYMKNLDTLYSPKEMEIHQVLHTGPNNYLVIINYYL